MKKGFQLFLQKDLEESDKILCIEYLENFIEKTLNHPKWNYFGAPSGGYTSGLWRGRYGREINHFKKTLSKTVVFRRISKNTRKFACVYAETLEIKNDKYLDKSHKNYRPIFEDGAKIPKGYMSPRQKDSLKVDWKIKPEFDLYKSFGEYKG